MAKEEIHVSDIGTSFELTIFDTVNTVATIVNISTQTALQLIFLKPDGSKLTKTNPDVNLVTDGTDGKMQYSSLITDLDQAGGWRLQGKVTMPTGTWYTDISNFIVWSNL